MDKLKPDFCPQINVMMEIEFGLKRMSGMVMHENKICVAKKLKKDNFLYNMFNQNKDKKEKTHLMKVHTIDNNNNLESISFIGITTDQFKSKKKMYEKNKNNM